MYGKIFKQMYKGTLAMVGPWEALVTFQQMIVLADRDGVVDMTSDAISRETTIPLKIIKKGIEALEQPDPESRTPDEDGRRIVLLGENRSWGWRIVNYDYYRKLRSEEERREYHRQYYRKNRSKSATKGNSTPTQQDSTDSTNSSKQKVVSSKHIYSKRVPITWSISTAGADFAMKAGMDTLVAGDELGAFRDHEYKSARKDWDAAWRTWCRNWKKWKRDETHYKRPDDFATVHARVKQRAGLN